MTDENQRDPGLWARDWYARNNPKAPPIDVEYFHVLLSLGAIYNIGMAGRDRATGPIRVFPGGIEVRLQEILSTFDFDNLTRLVLAAHHWHVRVQIASCSRTTLQLMMHKRVAPEEANHRWDGHPGLVDLANRVRIAGEAAAVTL